MIDRLRVPCEETQFGFIYGAAEVSRVFDMDGRVCIEIKTTAGKSIQVYVSAHGKSLRVMGQQEWVGKSK